MLGAERLDSNRESLWEGRDMGSLFNSMTGGNYRFLQKYNLGFLDPVGKESYKAGLVPEVPITAPTVMPLPDDANAVAARRRSLADQMARMGRASTILTQDSGTQKLGG